MLELLKINYKINDHRILRNINLKFENGIHGFIGANGAGKTTLLNIISTVIKGDTGSMFYKNSDMFKNPQSIRKDLSYLTQNPSLYLDLTVEQNIIYFGMLKGYSKEVILNNLNYLIDYFNIGDLLNTKIQTLSGGQMQKIAVITALVTNPKVLILDEPTNNIDEKDRNRLYEYLLGEKNDTIILISSHYTEEIKKISCKVFYIEKGEIIS